MLKISSSIVIALLGAQLSPVQELANHLTAPDVRVRMGAGTQLARDVDANPRLLEDLSIQNGVVSLLEAENAVVHRNIEGVKTSQQSQLAEGYGEHYAAALGLANRLRKADVSKGAPLQARLRRALVTGTYN